VPQPSLAQLGTAIRILREKRGLTIEALADEAELHVVSVSRIERGKQNASWIALLSITTVLEVEMLDLVKLAIKQPRAKR
jgi:transcriptional regulator with XRE-family HTH domain